MSKSYYIIPIFLLYLGCPHDCVFCNQKRITGLSTSMTSEKADNIIKDHLKTIPSKNRFLEIAFYGGSFTAVDVKAQAELLEVAYKYKREGMVDRIRLSTRPDYIDEKELLLLKEYGVDIIELGVQSLDEEVLFHSGRGHSKEIVYEASKLIKKHGFYLGHQMMIGLPEDTFEKALYTAKEIVKMNPFCVRIYPTLVIKDTQLERMFLRKTYNPLSLDEGVEIATDLLMMFNYFDINVIRVGLQPTENINKGKDVIAGPFHPSFRQLVESNIYKKVLSEYLSQKDLGKTVDLVFEINDKEVSNFVGQGAKNIKWLKEQYHLHNVKVYGKKLPENLFYMKNNEIYDKIDKNVFIKKYLKKNSLI